MMAQFARTQGSTYWGRAHVLIVLSIVALVGCHRSETRRIAAMSESSLNGKPAEELDAIGSAYVRLVLALGERDPDSLDFSIAPAAVSAAVHRSYPPLTQILSEASELQARLRSLNGRTHLSTEQCARTKFLAAQVASIEART